MVAINSSAKNLWSIIGQAQERKSAMEAARAAAHAPKPTLDEKGKVQEQFQNRVETIQSILRSYYTNKAQLEELSRPEIKAERLARGMTEERYQEWLGALRGWIKDFEEDVANGGPKFFAEGQLSGPLIKLGAGGIYTFGGATVTGPYGIKIDVPVSREGYEAGQNYLNSIESRAAERTEKDVARATDSLSSITMAMKTFASRYNALTVSLQPERMEALRQTEGDAAVQGYEDAARSALANLSRAIANFNNLGQQPEGTVSLSGQPLVKGDDGLYQFGEFSLSVKTARVVAQIDQTGAIQVARDGENFAQERGVGGLVVEGRDGIPLNDPYFDKFTKSYTKNNEVMKTGITQDENQVDLTI